MHASFGATKTRARERGERDGRPHEVTAPESPTQYETGPPTRGAEPRLLALGHSGVAYFLRNPSGKAGGDADKGNGRLKPSQAGVWFGNMTPRVWDIADTGPTAGDGDGAANNSSHLSRSGSSFSPSLKQLSSLVGDSVTTGVAAMGVAAIGVAGGVVGGVVGGGGTPSVVSNINDNTSQLRRKAAMDPAKLLGLTEG